MHFNQRRVNFFTIANNMRFLRREIEKRAYGAASSSPCAQLEDLPKQHENGDDCGGLEINADFALLLKRCGEDARREHHDGAIYIRNADAHRDERKHVGRPVADRLPSAYKKRPTTPKHYGRA